MAFDPLTTNQPLEMGLPGETLDGLGIKQVPNSQDLYCQGIIENVGKSWIIDKWWSEEEKIDLGISERKVSVGILVFALKVEDIANSIKGFEDEIKELAEKLCLENQTATS